MWWNMSTALVTGMKSFTFSLRPVPPFRLDLTVWALRRRARNIVDRWDGTTYRRVLLIDGIPLEVAIKQISSSDYPRLNIETTGMHLARDGRRKITSTLIHMLGLQTELTPFYVLAAQDKRLAPLVERFRGVKPPRFPSIFETLVNAIACQQLSLTVGIELLNRIANQCGPAFVNGCQAKHAFPRPEDLLPLRAQGLRSLGLSYSKAHSLLELSRSLVSGQFDPQNLSDLDNSVAVESLMDLHGVGRWTAEYVLLRGLGRTNVFPGDDVGARKRLAMWLGRDKPLDYDGVKRAVRRWQPYSGLVYFHLLLAGLITSGEFTQDA
jgi:DNA-3-methyladenine glycosylase II